MGENSEEWYINGNALTGSHLYVNAFLPIWIRDDLNIKISYPCPINNLTENIILFYIFQSFRFG